ncbi:MAG: hypothetical protein HY744_09065, partial [Deltaproteobacteria bacterium]|nr:hypothetical protein [Deltaproteobacteria bacterium]
MDVLKSSASLALAAMLGVAASALGCTTGEDPPLGAGAATVERLWQDSVDKVDILLAIDNSRSMADKQQILKEAVPDLVGALVNPRCVDENDKACKNQPQDPGAVCEASCKREFEPIKDIHIGLISSSIGGHGADACDPEEDPTQNFSVNDKAHLLSRKSTQSQEGIATFKNLGFL